MGMVGLINILFDIYKSWKCLRLLWPKVLTSTFLSSILPISLGVWGWDKSDMGS